MPWRSTRSVVAPSPTGSPSPSGSGRLREPQASSRLLPQWKLSQVLGELPPAADAHRDGAAQDDDADEISAIEFDARGEYLAAGDNAGRVILFRRTDDDDGDGQALRPRAELERADRAGAPPPPRYSYATEFQSHEPEFDVMHSLEISEKIEKVRWCARPNSSLLMLAANDRTVKLWKVSEHKKAPKKGNDRPPRWGSSARPQQVSDVGDGYTAKCRRVFGRAHEFNIHSVSNNWLASCRLIAGSFILPETLIPSSANEVRSSVCLPVNVQRRGDVRVRGRREDQPVAPGGDEPVLQHRGHEARGHGGSQVISTAEFHPSSCSLLAYGSSSGLVRLVDLRRSALCDQSVRIFQDRENRPQPSTFFTEIISCITDLKFTGDGKYLLTRDYMNLKLWDLRVETSPVATYKVHEFLRPKLSELYTDDYIFDRFSCCASKDGAYFATGSYSNTFKVFSRAAAQTSGTTLEASTNPYRIQSQAPTNIPALLSNFSLRVNRKGQDGPRSDGKEEVSCNMASKVKHLAWHPAENFIVCAANNNLYMYHT